MTRKQTVALKYLVRNKSVFDWEINLDQIQSRYEDELRNYEKLREMFPWLEEENNSYL